MKKLLALILALMLTLSCLVACGENSKDTDTEGTSSVSESDKTPDDSEKEEAKDSEKEEAKDSEKEEAKDSEKEEAKDSDELNADTLVGLWICEMDAGMVFGAEVGLNIEISYDFKKNGTVEVAMDVQKMVDNIKLETFAKISGVSVEEMKEAMEKQGLTMDDVKELIMDQVEENLAELGELKNGKISSPTMNYKLEDGKIYLSEDTSFEEEDGESYTYENGKLTVGELVLEKK